MATIVRTLVQSSDPLAPGQSRHHWWNNATYGKVYVLEVVPISTGSYQTGYNHIYQAQITQDWRKLITTQTPGSIGVNVSSELEVHYEVKNIGATDLVYQIKMAEID